MELGPAPLTPQLLDLCPLQHFPASTDVLKVFDAQGIVPVPGKEPC